MIRAHNPSLILITPPPVEETLMEATDRSKGHDQLIRTQLVMRSYAEMVCEVGKELDIPVLDIWTIFMAKAGWKPGEPLAGSKSEPKNKTLEGMMHDGMLMSV